MKGMCFATVSVYDTCLPVCLSVCHTHPSNPLEQKIVKLFLYGGGGEIMNTQHDASPIL